jgi:hypothetical protein
MNGSGTLTLIRALTLVSVLGLLWAGGAVRLLGQREAAGDRGGQPPALPACAKEVVDTTDSCELRVKVDTNGTKYRCTGKDLDQACEAAKTDTEKACDKQDATCSGSQQYWSTHIFPEGAWMDDLPFCSVPTYVKASLKDLGGKNKCTPAPEGP